MQQVSGVRPLSSGRAGSILVATHSPGRGRRTDFLPLLLNHIATSDPALRSRIKLWLTGTPLPPLEDMAAIVFVLADPLNLYPDCEREAKSLAGAARERGIAVFNPPEALNNTGKTVQSDIWRAAGLPCAGARSAKDEATLRLVLSECRYPIILRYDLGHVQESAFVCASEAEALSRAAGLRYPATVLEFVDTRESWRAARPESVMAAYFHKKRAMIFLGAVANNHVFFSEDAIVGQKASTFKAAHLGRPPPGIAEMVEVDVGFGLAPTEHAGTMLAATKALGLDVAAIDYSSRADGSIVLWEANPYFHLPHWSQALLPFRRRMEQRVTRFYDLAAARLDELTRVGADACLA